MLEKLALGLGVGMLFGFVLQRGRFCMYTAFRDLFLIRNTTLFKAYILALLVQIVLIHLLRYWDVISFGGGPFIWLSAMIGGFVFGLGMALAGGCASSSFYRVGEGMVGSFIAALAFIIFAAATSAGVLRPIATFLYAVHLDMEGGQATLPTLVGLNAWLMILVLVLGGGLWLFWVKSPRPVRAWEWSRTGLSLGLIAALAWWASSLTGRHYGLSMTGPSASLLLYLTSSNSVYLDWGVFQLIGVPLGAFVAASWNREFRWRSPQPKKLMLQFLGGAVMGMGAVIAGGCNIGNGLTGLGTLSLTSLVSTLFMILGTWTGTNLFFLRRRS